MYKNQRERWERSGVGVTKSFSYISSLVLRHLRDDDALDRHDFELIEHITGVQPCASDRNCAAFDPVPRRLGNPFLVVTRDERNTEQVYVCVYTYKST